MNRYTFKLRNDVMPTNSFFCIDVYADNEADALVALNIIFPLPQGIDYTINIITL